MSSKALRETSLIKAILLLSAVTINKCDDWYIQDHTKEALIKELKEWGLWSEEEYK